jgi:hypothetical protein
MFIIQTKTKVYTLYADSVSSHSMWSSALFAITQERKASLSDHVPTAAAAKALTGDEEACKINATDSSHKEEPGLHLPSFQRESVLRHEAQLQTGCDPKHQPELYSAQSAYQHRTLQANSQQLHSDLSNQPALSPSPQDPVSAQASRLPDRTPSVYQESQPTQSVDYQSKPEAYLTTGSMQPQSADPANYHSSYPAQPLPDQTHRPYHEAALPAKVLYPSKAVADDPDDIVIMSSNPDYSTRREPEPDFSVRQSSGAQPSGFKSAVKDDVSTIHREIIRPVQPVPTSFKSAGDPQPFTSQLPVNRSALIKESLDFGRTGMLDMIQDMEDFDLPVGNYQLRRPPSVVVKSITQTHSVVKTAVDPQSRYVEVTTQREDDGPKKASSTDWQPPPQPNLREVLQVSNPQATDSRCPPKPYQETPSIVEGSWDEPEVERHEGLSTASSGKQPQSSAWDDWDS